MTYDQLVRFVGLVMLALVPYILASQGTMLAGRTGVFNVAQEGIMLLGASAGFLATYLLGNLVYGLIAAGLAGAFFSLVIAFFTTRLKMDQFVIGLAVFFLCLGLANLLYKVVVGVTLIGGHTFDRSCLVRSKHLGVLQCGRLGPALPLSLPDTLGP
jgi:simple sugar transport system permease protein